ncbi:MAG: phosphotransferase [Eubacteriales bacterium]
MQQSTFNIDEILANFSFEGEFAGSFVLTNGHINNTFVLEFRNEFEQINSYLLQQINTNVFKNPDQLMENIVGVTAYLRNIIVENGGDHKRETLNVIFTKGGKSYFRDNEDKSWRCYDYITDSYTCQKIEDPLVFYNAAKAFGKFSSMLADYPIDTLYDTIPNFHNTVSRFSDLKKAIETNAAGRADSARPEIDFALAHEGDTGVLLDLLDSGKIPLRVTHNDTKLNNVMFDNVSNEGICVIDLDTVMPGLSLYDFGDSIRFGESTAEEDEKDVSKVELDLELFEQYTRGYLGTAGKSLTPCEVEYLPFAAKLITFECGIRFLGDYLNGDTYFRTDYDDHNLIRCRTQFALVADIERKMDKLNEIVTRIHGRL